MSVNLERAKTIVEEIKLATAEPCFKLRVNETAPLELTSSKLGGVPYWPESKSYPKCEGEDMLLLAQINLAQLPPDHEPLPSEGILQFFIAAQPEYHYGMNFADRTLANTFRVVYHDTIEAQVKSAETMPQAQDFESSPLRRAVALEIEPAMSFMCTSDGGFESILKKIVKEKFGETFDGPFYQFFSNDEMLYIEDNLNSADEPCHRLLGQPLFEQSDIRDDEQYSDCDVLLLQLGSQFVDGEELIMWGDMGIAQWFVPKAALQIFDLSRVLFSWDAG